MSTYRWIPWTQPVLTGNTDYGETSASSINNSSAGNPASPWKASDGIKAAPRPRGKPPKTNIPLGGSGNCPLCSASQSWCCTTSIPATTM